MHLPHELLERVAICADSMTLATLIGSNYASQRITMKRRIKSLDVKLAGLSYFRPLTYTRWRLYTNWNDDERNPIVMIHMCIDDGKLIWIRHFWTGWDAIVRLITIREETGETCEIWKQDIAQCIGVPRPQGLEAARIFLGTILSAD